jgi:Spy/CpxP family protein refolding chaperone
MKLLIGLALGALASVAVLAALPHTFAADEDRPPRREPPPGDRREPPPPPPLPPPHEIDRAVEDLRLSREQRDKVDKVMRAHHERMRKLFEKARKDLVAGMKDVLSKEQLAEFEKALDRRPPGPPGGDRDGDRPPPPPRDGKERRGGKERPGKEPPPRPRPDDE